MLLLLVVLVDLLLHFLSLLFFLGRGFFVLDSAFVRGSRLLDRGGGGPVVCGAGRESLKGRVHNQGLILKVQLQEELVEELLELGDLLECFRVVLIQSL
jgi:hypothetical protein